MPDRRMIFGLRVDTLPLAHLAEVGALAEAAGLDFVLTGAPDRETDEAGGRDALSIASFLMTKTHEIGLGATVSQSAAPFNVARSLASMDHLCGGRCGWMPVSSGPACEERDAEHLEVVVKLFDSWDDDALVFDKAASVFTDRTKVRRIRHAGAHFTVDGPLNAPRPVQGHPVLMQTASASSPIADILIAADGDQHAKADGPLSLREIALDLEFNTGGEFASLLAARFSDTRCAGFLLTPRTLKDVQAFVRDAAPHLHMRGLLQRTYAPGDFRTRLGLCKPTTGLTAVATLTGANL